MNTEGFPNSTSLGSESSTPKGSLDQTRERPVGASENEMVEFHKNQYPSTTGLAKADGETHHKPFRPALDSPYRLHPDPHLLRPSGGYAGWFLKYNHSPGCIENLDGYPAIVAFSIAISQRQPPQCQVQDSDRDFHYGDRLTKGPLSYGFQITMVKAFLIGMGILSSAETLELQEVGLSEYLTKKMFIKGFLNSFRICMAQEDYAPLLIIDILASLNILDW